MWRHTMALGTGLLLAIHAGCSLLIGTEDITYVPVDARAPDGRAETSTAEFDSAAVGPDDEADSGVENIDTGQHDRYSGGDSGFGD